MEEQITQEGFPTLESVKAPQQAALFDLENYTLTNVNSLERLQHELKEARATLADILHTSEKYKEEEGTFTEVSKNFKAVKSSLLQRPDIMSLTEKVKEIRNAIKEKKESVSMAALEYSRVSGFTQIDKDGVTYEIVRVAKIVKRTQ